MHSAAAWSMISDTPLFVRDSRHNADICYWGGVALTRKHAQLIIAECWLNMYSSQIMMEEIRREYNHLLKNSELPFTTDDPHAIKLDLLLHIAQSDDSFIPDMSALTNKYSSQTALSWLLSERVITI